MRSHRSARRAPRALAVLFAAALSLAFAGCSGLDASSPDSGSAPGVPQGFEQAEVVRVVDGDTLQVYLDGSKQKVRLIGINCPESVATDESRNTAEGHDASDFTHMILSEGDVIWLQSDVNDVDQYDRLLRYVWIDLPYDPFDIDEVADKMLNGILVVEGFAEARTYGEDRLYAEILDILEDDAVANGRGVSYLWE